MRKTIDNRLAQAFFLFFLIFLLGGGCANRREEAVNFSEGKNAHMEYSDAARTSSMAAGQEIEPTPQENRRSFNDDAVIQLNASKDSPASKIIYTAKLELQVQDLDPIEKQLPLLLTRFQGYIANQRYQKLADRQSLFYTLRVPVSFFDSVLQNLCAQALYVSQKSITGADVSQLYYDLEIRLDSKQKALAQYQAILQKAQNVKEILEVEDRLRIVQEEIDALEGQIRYYSNRIAFATIEVEFYRVDSMGSFPESSFITRAVKALEQGWEGVVGAFTGLLYIWPILLLALTVFFLIRRYKRVRSARNRAIKPQPPFG
jgi:hypothetical protein